jgi:rRNA maturation protein Nop10
MDQNASIYTRFEKLSAENLELKDRIIGYQEKIHDLRRSHKKSLEEMKAFYDGQISKKDAVIKGLSGKLARSVAGAAHDGTNTGTPTAATPIGKKKVIPNSRGGSGKKRGGQPGHAKHAMPPFEGQDVTETVAHIPECVCASCGGQLLDSGEIVEKDEFDVEIRVVKRRHEYHVCRCAKCGATARQPIPTNLKEQNQYGSQAQALALSLMNTGNVAINKVRTLLSGMTGGSMLQSEGYIAKLQYRAATGLNMFVEELKATLIHRTIVYWDDTVIMIDTEKGCLRFYGDDTISLYAAHEHKGMEGLDDDGILGLLQSTTSAMHDHNKVNYNEKFFFQNLECNQHLQRDLQKNSDDTGHIWSAGLKKLISSTIHDRKAAIAREETSFQQEYIEGFKVNVKSLLAEGLEELRTNPGYKEAADFERRLLVRTDKYHDNYFRWVEDFSLPTTNNLSERGLRCIKSHMKISGQFINVMTARNYATIKTYIETCRKNNINEMFALSRLCQGNPISVSEIFG